MNFFERLRNGWTLAKQSLQVVWRDKTLMIFPVLSGISCLAAIGLFVLGFGPENIQRLLDETGGAEAQISTSSYILVLLVYFVLYFITIFFNVALVGCARISLSGGDSKLSDGFTVALSHLPSIVGWALLSGTVGLLLSLLENEKKTARFVRVILGTAWSIITYFVIPVIVVEGVGAFKALGRSTSIIKQTWGESLAAHFSIGWLLFIINLPAILIFVVIAITGSLPPALMGILIGCAAMWLVFTTVMGLAAKSVLTMALYQYSATGTAPDVYDTHKLRYAFS